MEFTDDYKEVRMEPEELRNIIKGVTEVRRCPDCEGHGEQWVLHYVLADDPNENEEFKNVNEVFATNFIVDDHPQYSWGECHLYDCDTCKGVGYIMMEQW